MKNGRKMEILQSKIQFPSADNLVQVGFFFTDLLICHYPMFINHSRFAKILLQTSTISDVVQYMF